MDMKKVRFLCGIIFSISPIFAHATDILLSNNTKSPLTGKASIFCSSQIKGIGALEPNSNVNIKQSDIDKFCHGSCTIDIYMNRNCDGKSVSTVKISQKDGVTNINNHGVDGYYATGGGGILTVSGGPAKSWFDFLFS